MIMENVLDLMRERHSVRSYEPTPIGATAVAALNDLIAQCNREGDLNIRLITEEPRAFGNILTHYGQFHGVRNYFALAGKNAPDLYERVGYHGERLVLEAQRLGLNTCWVALSYSKRRVPMVLDKDERLVCVIAVGHGISPGHGHKVRSFDQVAHAPADAPQWFRDGVEAALLAPTAINQQKFLFTFVDDGHVKAQAKRGFYSHIDLGIVKLHFELAAAPHPFTWVE